MERRKCTTAIEGLFLQSHQYRWRDILLIERFRNLSSESVDVAFGLSIALPQKVRERGPGPCKSSVIHSTNESDYEKQASRSAHGYLSNTVAFRSLARVRAHSAIWMSAGRSPSAPALRCSLEQTPPLACRSSMTLKAPREVRWSIAFLHAPAHDSTLQPEGLFRANRGPLPIIEDRLGRPRTPVPGGARIGRGQMRPGTDGEAMADHLRKFSDSSNGNQWFLGGMKQDAPAFRIRPMSHREAWKPTAR